MARPYGIRVAMRTDTGIRRRTNEDAVGSAPRHGVCVVCDGMGGHASGEVASRLALTTILEGVRRELPTLEERLVSNGLDWGARIGEVLERMIARANAAVYERGRSDPAIEDGRPMGTTVAAWALAGERAVLAHVGDSRIYRWRAGRVEPLTEDHSLTTSEEERRRGRKRKYVTRAVGTRRRVRVALRQVEVGEGDRFLLCTDGLTDCVRDEEIAAVLGEAGSDEEAAGRLVALANARGGRDNVSVVIVRIVASGPEIVGPSAGGGHDPGVPVLEPPPAVESASIPGEGLTCDDLGVQPPDAPPPPAFEPPPPNEVLGSF